MGIKSARASANGDPEPRDSQQVRLLSILRRRAGEPVPYSELQAAGIEFPASVVAELELGGVEIERCQSGVRLPINPSASELPPPPTARVPEPMRVYRTPIRRVRLLAPLALLVGIGAIVAVIVAGVSGGKAHLKLATRSLPRPHAASHATVQPRAQLAITRSRASHTTPVRPQAPVTSPPVASVSQAATSATPTPAAPSPSLAANVGTPAVAVQRFYEAAAHHDYGAAWALADANMRAQLQGYSAFANEMSPVRAISFHQAETLSGEASNVATVHVATTSVQSDRTQQCSGSVRTVRTSAGWLLDGISISCS